jgi:NADPH:quinone reductase
MRAIRVAAPGGPEVLTMADMPDLQPADGLVHIKVSSAGVNFADTMIAADDYIVPTVAPYTPGREVVGTTPDGRRVVALASSGAYAEYALAAEEWVVDLPGGVSDGQALALITQGLTAWHLVHSSARVQPGDSVVVQSAAGGVGSLAVQWATAQGAGVIAIASSPEERDLAISLGAHQTVNTCRHSTAGVRPRPRRTASRRTRLKRVPSGG